MAVSVGDIVECKVSSVMEFGAFVDFDGGKSGLIHISEISGSYVKNINDVISVGQEVKAKIISINPNGKISLSIKQIEIDSNKKEQPSDRVPKTNNKKPPQTWQGNNKKTEPQTFEEMMANFKKASDEKMSDLKRIDSKRGSTGYSRRGR